MLLKPDNTVHTVKASDFASLSDVRAFQRCKATGKTDKQCFAVGDNGIGYWGDNTAQESVPMCALPPDDIQARFGDADKGRLAKIKVVANSREVICALADHMPWKKNIKNGAGIDLNPAALKVLGLQTPIMVTATWQWV
jgi:hypothetical protein